jgi:hypothetical protein
MMRRRFGRRRWGGGSEGNGEGPRGLDPARELARVIQSGVVPADALEPVETGEVPASLAVVGTGTSRDGERLVVGVSPGSGGDAWLGALAVAARLAQEEAFDGAVYAVSGSWSLSARRRLGLQRPGPLLVRARIEPDAQDFAGEVTPEGLETPVRPAASLPAGLGEAARPLWRRAIAALAGLAAKHGGAVRPAPSGIELVFAGRPVAILRGDAQGVGLEAWEPRRELQRLAPDALADAFDRFEGGLRKVLADRRLREGEPALRAALAARLADTAGVHALAPWPLAGPLGEGIDFAGVDGHGRAVVGVARPELGLLALGAALDGWIELVPRIANLLPEAPAPNAAPPLLLLAAERFDPAAERVLACLEVEARAWAASGLGRGELSLAPHALAAVRAERGAGRSAAAPPVRASEPERPAAPPLAPATGGEVAGEPGAEGAPRRRFEEVSLFDLAAEGEEGAGPGRRGRRRRRRGRGRGPRAGGAEVALQPEQEERDEDDESEPEAEAAEPGPSSGEPGEGEERRGGRRRRGRGRGGRDRERERRREDRPHPVAAVATAPEPGADEEEDLEDEELLVLAEVPDVPEVEEEAAEPGFEEEEEEEESPEDARLRQEREARRRARIAKVEPEVAPPPRPPRRRAAFLAHADRESIGAAVLLARETRLVEGIWVYPQVDLMTFFRGVATDLREDTPICVIGFTASPARDTLQAASLYRDRLTWFDHHEWPPEDLERLRGSIGAEAVHVDPDAGSVLPLVLATCARRSRFSDKLVDLLTGRFSRHDWERWGRLWWWRLGQIAGKTGERRAELEPLIGGRPSDLSREASRAAPPPVPAEAEWAAGRDFRLVHFGGYALVRVPVPPALDPHLAARIARERYAAELSVAWTEGSDRLTLGADEGVGRRAFDLGAMVEHLAEKFRWVKPLADADHVARFRVEGAAAHPERIDEVVGEIAMGRSILEG